MNKSRNFMRGERLKLEKLYNSGEPVKTIAESMGRHPSTVYKELQKGYTNVMDKNGRIGYDAELAQLRAYTKVRAAAEKKKAKAAEARRKKAECV